MLDEIQVFMLKQSILFNSSFSVLLIMMTKYRFDEWTKPYMHNKRQKFIFHSIFIIVKSKSCQIFFFFFLTSPCLTRRDHSWDIFVLSLHQQQPPFHSNPSVKTKWWHKELCSSFIPQLSFCLCHPPRSPPPVKPFTYRNSKKGLIPLSLQHQPHRLMHTSIVKIKEMGLLTMGPLKKKILYIYL